MQQAKSGPNPALGLLIEAGANWTEKLNVRIIAGCNHRVVNELSGGIPLANTKSALKQWRQNEKRRARNRMVRSRTHTFVKKADAIILDGNKDEALEAVKQAISELDRAVKKGIIHANNAARRKSRLMKRFNALS